MILEEGIKLYTNRIKEEYPTNYREVMREMLDSLSIYKTEEEFNSMSEEDICGVDLRNNMSLDEVSDLTEEYIEVLVDVVKTVVYPK